MYCIVQKCIDSQPEKKFEWGGWCRKEHRVTGGNDRQTES